MSFAKEDFYSDYDSGSTLSKVPYESSKRVDNVGALSGYGHSGYGQSGYGGSYKQECCPIVIDKLCLLAILFGVVGATFFLNQVILMTTFTRKRKRSLFSDIFWIGKIILKPLESQKKLVFDLGAGNNMSYLHPLRSWIPSSEVREGARLPKQTPLLISPSPVTNKRCLEDSEQIVKEVVKARG